MAKKKKKGAAEQVEKKLARVMKKSAQEKLPDFLTINDIQILMPLEITLMRSDLTKIQLSVLLSLIEKLAYKLKEKIEMQKFENGEDSELKVEGIQLALWKDDEWLLNDKNERIFRLKLFYKEVGVNRNHYDQLESSLKALTGLPISFPYKDKEGKGYTKYTNFCDVIIPDNQSRNKYCYVDFEEKVAKALTKVDFGYHYVGKKASIFFGNCSKYCERIYFLIQGYQNVGSVRITTEEFRKRYGLEDSYKNFSAIKSSILDPSVRDIKRVFDLGGCPCWFEYKEIFRGSKTTGDPYEIEFIIHKENDGLRIDRQLTIEESVGKDKFREILLEGLHLSPKFVDGQCKRLTDENCQAAISRALNIKVYIDSGKVDNPTFYAAKSLSNFFETYVPSVQVTKESYNKTDWDKMMMDYCKTVDPAAVRETISLMTFGGYDPEKKSLIICFPDIETKTRMDNYGPSFIKAVKKYFGEEVKTQFTIKEKEVTDAV